MTNLILVTGGLGYIGSHTVLKLIDFGYDVIIIDNCMNSNTLILNKLKFLSKRSQLQFYNYDLCDQCKIDQVFEDNQKIYAVIHFAAYKSVPESLLNPSKYYHNNVVSTVNLINSMKKYNCNNLIYSSSACVYGKQPSPCREDMFTGISITNPYGETKYMCEQLIKEECKINRQFNAVSLRYFNPVGSHSSGLIGEHKSSSLMSNLINSFIYDTPFNLYGDNYDTSDGSCIRDFIHIDDLVYGHIVCIKTLTQNTNYKIYNLGTGTGYSVLELIERMSYYYKKYPKIIKMPRREGDVPVVYADVSKIKHELDWSAKKTIDDICKDTIRYIHTSLTSSKKIPCITLNIENKEHENEHENEQKDEHENEHENEHDSDLDDNSNYLNDSNDISNDDSYV